MKELIDRHSGIVADIARRYCSSDYGSGMNVHELNDEIPFIVWQATKSYDPSFGTKFPTWLYNTARGKILDRRRKMSRSIETVELTDEISNFIASPEPEQISADDQEKIDEMKSSLKFLKNDRNRAIIQKRFFGSDFKSLKQIADECECTPQYAGIVTDRFIKQKQKRYERQTN
jgi:RNA polymerase sigma factor (sigma-70 family)